ncbi:MAG: hypothetical protein ACK4MM_03770, partial [Fervidobacterium sp.]
GIKTTFITLIVLPIFLGIGVDSLVELDHSVRYGRESIIKTEKAVILSILTTVISFGSFLVARGKLLREFGFVTSSGLIGALFISLFWYLNTIDKPKIFKRDTKEESENEEKQEEQEKQQEQESEKRNKGENKGEKHENIDGI